MEVIHPVVFPAIVESRALILRPVSDTRIILGVYDLVVNKRKPERKIWQDIPQFFKTYVEVGLKGREILASEFRCLDIISINTLGIKIIVVRIVPLNEDFLIAVWTIECKAQKLAVTAVSVTASNPLTAVGIALGNLAMCTKII